ncbi:MAG: SUMF1/EgtB/PvdO family nonheme iron enzyme, partial [Lautropia sp.]|nr:SUMF1/EgtB/PvdO family nonheme iron enzyme [Lautropia sp.]
YWPGEAGRWRTKADRSHPERWRRITRNAMADVRWESRWFDRWQVLDPAQPVIHVNAFEAEAYCHWAARALPTAAQWEHAASGRDGAGRYGFPAAFRWGRSVWEWTADAFQPYPGFAPGPYRDYSAPWFGSHRELRGGAFATHSRLHDAGYRNFFMAHRSDIFAGFRTVGPQGQAATGTIATCHRPT